MNLKVAVRGIIFHEGKLLCAQLHPYRKVPDQKEFWCTPGGGVDEGEALIPALEREMIEETGIAAKVGALLYIQQFPDGNAGQLEFFFHIENAEDYLDIDLAKSTHGVEEIKAIGFIDPAKYFVLPKFLSTEDIARHIKNNRPPKIFNYL